MSNGIIMETKRSHYIVMTPNGEFLKIKKEGIYQIGATISFEMKEKPSIKEQLLGVLPRKQVLSFGIVMMTMLMLVLGGILPNLFMNETYAYVNVDINPSIKIEVNQNGQVTELTHYNHDGYLLIKELHLAKKDPLAEVMNKILFTSKKMGYLKESKTITVSYTYEGKEKEKWNVSKEIQKSLKENKIKAITKEIPKEDFVSAEKNEISPNKYVLVKELKKESPTKKQLRDYKKYNQYSLEELKEELNTPLHVEKNETNKNKNDDTTKDESLNENPSKQSNKQSNKSKKEQNKKERFDQKEKENSEKNNSNPIQPVKDMNENKEKKDKENPNKQSQSHSNNQKNTDKKNENKNQTNTSQNKQKEKEYQKKKQKNNDDKNNGKSK